MKLVKRSFRMVLGMAFAAIGAFLFIGSLIVAFIDQIRPWTAMCEFGVFGIFIVIAGTAMCFEKD
jgi:hypothetical protein